MKTAFSTFEYFIMLNSCSLRSHNNFVLLAIYIFCIYVWTNDMYIYVCVCSRVCVCMCKYVLIADQYFNNRFLCFFGPKQLQSYLCLMLKNAPYINIQTPLTVTLHINIFALINFRVKKKKSHFSKCIENILRKHSFLIFI